LKAEKDNLAWIQTGALVEHFEFLSENIGEKHVLFFTEIFTFFFNENFK
jgi:hypothetical protein